MKNIKGFVTGVFLLQMPLGSISGYIFFKVIGLLYLFNRILFLLQKFDFEKDWNSLQKSNIWAFNG